ncbi:MAG: DASS family sodium-coupled anion symporter [Thermoplasmatales archaeon]|nr:MAG: DASS family sodium-coupled anion symporter [Thermoplasmatales archaeon]
MNESKNIVKNKTKSLSLRDIFFILLAFAIILIFYFIPTPLGLTFSGKMVIGILIMAAILWITEPIPLPVTGLLIMIIQPLLGIIPAKDVFLSFGNQAIFFLIGAFIIAAAIEKHGLHKRAALKFLSYFEKNPKFFTLGIMISCASLSFIMPEHGVAALFLPIIVSILIAMKIVPRHSNFGKISILSVAYGCSIGSLGTLIGGARNPLTIGFLSRPEIGINVTFFEWIIMSLPVVVISLPLVWLVLQFSFPIEIKDITLAKKEINKQVAVQGKINGKELTVLGIVVITILLWIFLPNSPFFGLGIIAILGSTLLFLTGSVKWEDIEKRVPWGIILLYGGAITLGIGMQTTQNGEIGAGEWIANEFFSIAGNNPVIVIIAMIIFTIFLTNIMSNVAAVAILLPISVSIATKIGINPLFASMIVALTGGLAFMFVISTPGNAITYSSGYYSTRDLFKTGILASIICIAVVFTIAIVYWKEVLHLWNI